MAVNQTVNPAQEALPFGASQALERINAAITEATDRSRGVMEAGIEAWTREAQRFQDELSVQGTTALEQLKACKSPLDVLSVEQAWVAARSKAYLETGLRFAQAFATIAQGLKDSDPPPPPGMA